MVFARSNRTLQVMAAGWLTIAFVLLQVAGWRLAAGDGWTALLLVMLAATALAGMARSLRDLRRGPRVRLGLFRDRLVLLQGRAELFAPWSSISGVTLADQSEWGLLRWPQLRLTDRMTVRLQAGSSFSFWPRSLGLDGVACRDLLLRLLGDPSLRARLPDFESDLDLTRRPLHAGELTQPAL